MVFKNVSNFYVDIAAISATIGFVYFLTIEAIGNVCLYN
jgi:hypothetical protein